jgi:ankyrin repeat protein
MTRALPPIPHPDHLRRQARDLLRAWRAGDAEALARARPWRLEPPWQRAAAQFVLAREHGQPSWPRLMAEVEARRAAALDDAAFVAAVVGLAVGQGWQAPQPTRALAMMARRPSTHPVLALLRGDLAAAEHGLVGQPIDAPLPPLDAPALVYAAASGLARLDSHHPALLATVDALLARGASADARWCDPENRVHTLPVLYGAVARARSLPIVERLLAAGADPNDHESLYHAAEQPGGPMLAALVGAGARWIGSNALLHQLDHDDLPGLAQALALGADPNEAGPGGRRALHHALWRGRGAESVRLLLAHGADPRATDDLGLAAAAYALRSGARDALALLQDQGAPALTAQEAFAAACAAGDEAAARSHLAAQPDAVKSLPPHLLRLLPEQAQRGRHGAVALMLSLGWPVAVTGDWDASALNQAAFRGDAAMVRLLLAHGARWDERNGYGGTALGSCLHAACNEPVPGGNYADVLTLLLDAGAPVPEDVDALPETLQDRISART